MLIKSCNKTLENFQKNMRSGALFYKTYTTDTSLGVITKEKLFKKISSHSFPIFSNVKALQSGNIDFNKNRLKEKCFLRAF